MLIWEAAVVIGALLRPAAKSVRENSGLAVISLVLAFGLWIFVTDAAKIEDALESLDPHAMQNLYYSHSYTIYTHT